MSAAVSLNVAAADDIVVMPRADSDNAGYNLGVSAMFAGVSSDRLVIAGGANFPDKPAADGGRKAYYNDIFVLEDSVADITRLSCPKALPTGQVHLSATT